MGLFPLPWWSVLSAYSISSNKLDAVSTYMHPLGSIGCKITKVDWNPVETAAATSQL
jgi:hypothetical protein